MQGKFSLRNGVNQPDPYRVDGRKYVQPIRFVSLGNLVQRDTAAVIEI